MVMGEEKLLALGKHLRDTGHTQASIASQLGVSQPYVNALLTGRKAFGKSQAKKWGDLYGLSPSWLLTGEGSMLKADAPITQTSPENSARPLVSSDRDWVEIPLVPHRAKAGALSGFGDPCWEEDKQTMPVLIDKRLKGDYLLFEVSGDSMDDGTSTAFLDGDVLLCRVLPKSDWQYGIKRRRDTYCVVATEAEGIVLKEVVNHDKATNEITCHSLNSQYKDYSVKLDDVQGIFYVEELIKRRF
jgi:Predicted transcriptional regulator|nr:MAG TPA: putative transcriptional regulator [Caudoviricetes sp.]